MISFIVRKVIQLALGGKSNCSLITELALTHLGLITGRPVESEPHVNQTFSAMWIRLKGPNMQHTMTQVQEISDRNKRWELLKYISLEWVTDCF